MIKSTFESEICTFDGDTRWEYNVVFSENFDRIESGELISYDEDGEIEVTEFKRSTNQFGFGLTYILSQKSIVEELLIKLSTKVHF